jgi:hypothetical protein
MMAFLVRESFLKVCGRHACWRARRLLRRPLPFARLDHFIDLTLDGVEVEGRGRIGGNSIAVCASAATCC